MQLTQLRIRDFRCLRSVDVTPGPGINVIVGDNASGKTSLLEAMYCLGRGRSFRGTPAGRLVRQGADAFSIVGRIGDEGYRRHRIGIAHRGGQTRYKLDGDSSTSLLDLVSTLPMQVIDPNLHRLLEQGPDVRRRYLDWGVFHVEHAFYPAWRRYRRALRQRNSALRAGQSRDAVIVWDAELVHAAEEVDACRRGYVAALERMLPDLVREILGEGEIVLEYHAGWSRDEAYASALIRQLDSDRRAGYTHAGPHRADLRVRVAGMPAKDWVSRGQQKILTAAFLLSQSMLLEERRGIRPLLLIDDLAAELGGAYRSGFMRAVERTRAQCFLTFLHEGLVPDGMAAGRMFHVEHGAVRPRG